jgi:hypothetical protein
VLGGGFRVLGDGFQVLDDGFWILDDGFRVLGDGFRVLDDGFRVFDSRFRVLAPTSGYSPAVSNCLAVAFDYSAMKVKLTWGLLHEIKSIRVHTKNRAMQISATAPRGGTLQATKWKPYKLTE